MELGRTLPPCSVRLLPNVLEPHTLDATICRNARHLKSDLINPLAEQRHREALAVAGSNRFFLMA